jgi:hypothetical protein
VPGLQVLLIGGEIRLAQIGPEHPQNPLNGGRYSVGFSYCHS